LLLVKAAAQLLGVPPTPVRTRAAGAKLKEYRHPVNNYRLFKRADVEKLLRAIRHPLSWSGAKGKRKFEDER